MVGDLEFGTLSCLGLFPFVESDSVAVIVSVEDYLLPCQAIEFPANLFIADSVLDVEGEAEAVLRRPRSMEGV